MRKVILFLVLGLGFLCTFVIFGAESITITRQIAGQTVQLTFTVGEAVVVAIGSGCTVTATILGFAKRRRVNVRFRGGQRATITQSALQKEKKAPEGKKK